MNSLEYSFFFNKRIVDMGVASPITLLTDSIFNQLNQSARNEALRKIALNNILTNIIVGYLNGRNIVISKSANHYSNYEWYGLKHFTFRLIVGWVEKLIAAGYLKEKKGFYDLESKTGERTRLFSTEKLISTLDEVKSDCNEIQNLYYTRNIVLKDSEKRLIKYSLSTRLFEKIKFLNQYNEFISGFNIVLPVNLKLNSKSYYLSDSVINLYNQLRAEAGLGSAASVTATPLLITLEANQLINKQLQAHLHRVFNVSFSRGGRFYGSYQQLNEEDRAKLRINDSPVCEVDYSAFHLNMLYHLTGKQFDGDPYSAVERDEIRPILKVLCLIAINSKDKSQALRALQDTIRKNWEFQKLKRIYHLDEKELLRKFESVHAGISNYFCSGIGLKLMYRDSQIAEDVLKHFTRREIPCLCVHDSFITPKENESELRHKMISVYEDMFGFKPKLKMGS